MKTDGLNPVGAHISASDEALCSEEMKRIHMEWADVYKALGG